MLAALIERAGLNEPDGVKRKQTLELNLVRGASVSPSPLFARAVERLLGCA